MNSFIFFFHCAQNLHNYSILNFYCQLLLSLFVQYYFKLFLNRISLTILIKYLSKYQDLSFLVFNESIFNILFIKKSQYNYIASCTASSLNSHLIKGFCTMISLFKRCNAVGIRAHCRHECIRNYGLLNYYIRNIISLSELFLADFNFKTICTTQP